MAPEQIQGKPQPASDQYALGIVVYEWLSGSLPFNGTAAEIAMQHVLAPIPSLRGNGHAISPEVEQVVMTSLAKDPKKHFGNVQDFATALEQAYRGMVNVAEKGPTKPTPVQEPPLPRVAADVSRSGEWAMFGYDPQPTHYNPNEQLISSANINHLVVAWSASTGNTIYLSSPAVANGLVYIGSWDKKFYAFEAATGKLRWSASTGGFLKGTSSSPAVANGLVYIGSYHKLYAFEATTGQVCWSAPIKYLQDSSPVVANGLIYINSDKLYAFEATTGKLRWSAPIEHSTDNCSPAVANRGH